VVKPEENIEIENIRRLRRGDESAFEFLFYRYRNRVKGFVYRMVPPHISSDKVVQEVFIKVWQNREKIDPTKKFSTYLFTISKNLVLDELKAAVNKKIVYTENTVLEEVMLTFEPHDNSEEELETFLGKLLQKLPERRRQIFCLNRFEGFTYKQIAQKLNISENTVDTQIRKSLHFLRQEFQSIL